MNSAQAADAPESRYEQATAYRRLGGRLIDLLLLSVTIFGVLLLLGLALQGSGKDYAVAIVWMTAGFVAVAYDTLFIGLAGSTPGMRVLGMRVVNASGARPGIGRALLRTIMLYLFMAVMTAATVITAFLVGWIFLRGLGRYEKLPQDSLSRTWVVCEVKGGLSRVTSAPENGKRRTSFADLDKLRSDGIISEEEYERKRRELGV